MNSAEYIRLAQNTKSNLFFPPADYTSLQSGVPSAIGPMTVDVAHAIIGLATEAGELLAYSDKTNLAEEIGDMFWYCAIYAYARGEIELNYPAPPMMDMGTVLELDLTVEALNILDHLKKSLFYGKQIDYQKVDEMFARIYQMLCEFARMNNLDPNAIMAQNIEKLRTRYPDKFSADKANDRDIVSERKTLEGFPMGPTHGGNRVVNERLNRE